ncbi:D-sedoheptulose 7-phosphate isomerase [Parabacteroides sp. PF5-5]|uniref:D-sedoheptulose-7-phosphate isomerase n=1 Tax=unclassified Parabacteroides TaxID=2649774 RepID=UPI002473812E|nr:MULTISPECIES: D-sedoheptulose 7-phosphate isomerase [unclassified Parabacteroides]MDH6306796.1 D-sedoheptulose 7-phosphate isomerase [Parabacteroides sp. PH5-39]MDH6317682.1 D-sedoheptulose 7-phosphate isomerase [Parabacteroides sp. PF5-13]MDH6321508.1 D-sedoheptulose 7-phosphate isomerase [Parabacteroides sp. PH5-13]MDH6325215.1 D-sedoheptulose 7-phosphate isomerase [Parabacteroides sp. PH5-8]MDH6328867.1 D-sedoheptulose 7-phosphate isomerase [Parabacteroides sp. PH5-41]
MDSKRTIKQRLEEHQEVIRKIMADDCLQQTISEVVNAITACFKNGGKVFFCGNGGSAADAQHLAAEFSGKFYMDREVLPSEALHCNTSYMTAVGNDYSFDIVYARLIAGMAKTGDILVGLSTSGNSANILKAFEVCREKGITTIAFTGETGGKMKSFSDYLINIPETDTPRIQEAHITVGHIVCELVESAIFSK